ncbi:MAG: HAMP domain-containing sensor histidine kinase [Chrysiogenales bacterium]
METLLSPRLKNITWACLAGLLAVGALYSKIFLPQAWTAKPIEILFDKNSAEIEALMNAGIQSNIRRSNLLLSRFKSGQLTAEDFEKKEALIGEKNGVIDFYFGEIYYFKSLALAKGDWRLLKKNQDIYFIRCLDSQIFYLHYFMDLKSNLIQSAWKYPCAVFDLKYSPAPIVQGDNGLAYDQVRNSFYYRHILKAGQNQLIVNLIFSSADFSRYFKKRNSLFFYGFVFLLFLVISLAFGNRLWLQLPALGGMAFAAWFFIAWLSKTNIYLPRFVPAVNSVWQLLAVLLFIMLAYSHFSNLKQINLVKKQDNLLSKLLILRSRVNKFQWRPNNFLACILFNLLAVAAFYFIDKILRSVDFPFGEFAFNPDFLGLLALLFGLHFFPLLAAGKLLGQVSWRLAWPIVLLQMVLLVFYERFLSFAFLSFSLLALLFIVFLLSRQPFWPRLLLFLLLALSISHWLAQYSRIEKQEFISANLKNIFASQNHYAKLVAREIVYEINAQKGQFYPLFSDDSRDELANIWNNTLAAREAIASGLYVVAKDGRLLHSFSYQIPYIDIKKKDIFPFWHVEAVDADLFGKKISLAVATINVFEKERYIGYIMVQVLNSAELILRSQGQKSIFNLDRKITSDGMGYLKMDGSGGILENPANINVENLTVLLKTADKWVTFNAMGVDYNGYVFKSNDESIIIFYPTNTFFKTFSEFIKILVFILLLLVIFYFRQLKELHWRLVFQSFSLKVFVILVLLSMFTAAVFSVFSLNFNSLALESQLQRGVYSRGRSALNIINNLLAENGEITQNHLFLLEKILENDISVYENGVLLYTSNHRKIIQSQLPIYLDSGIRAALRQNNQQFYLQKMGNLLALYFKTGSNYIFNIEFASNSANSIRSRQYYLDFLITVLFILIVIGIMAAFYFRNKILAPIHLLNKGMADVQQGLLQPLQDMPAEIELRELVQGFNAMLEGIKEQKKNVSEIARMKTLVELGRRVAHEVKNPLTPIKLSAEQILRSLQDQGSETKPLITKAVRYIIEETEHLQRVAYGFLNLSKLDELQPEPFILATLINEEISHFQPIYPNISFIWQEPAAAVAVKADRLKIKQVIVNVLNNSLEAIGSKPGQVNLNVQEQGPMILMAISDNGNGISKEGLAMMRSENYSSKDLGTGLGLVIARRFLELHGGSLEIESRLNEGTTIFLRFKKDVTQA